MNNTTLKELLENPQIRDIAPDAIRGWDLSKEDFYNETLSQLAESRNWINLERGFGRLFEISRNGDYYFKLYTKDECINNHEKDSANTVFFPSEENVDLK